MATCSSTTPQTPRACEYHVVKTLGIDLATEKNKTGICLIDWSDSGAAVLDVDAGHFGDPVLVDRMVEVLDDGGWVGIDAPFGFPGAFTEAVRRWSTDELLIRDPWLVGPRDGGPKAAGDRIQWRRTDRLVRDRLDEVKHELSETGSRWPLSSVCSMVTPSAIRCARLLAQARSRIEETDKIALQSDGPSPDLQETCG